MGTVKNVVGLLAVESFGVFLLWVVCKYAFGVDIFDFDTTRGKYIAFGIVCVFLYTFSAVLFEPGEIRRLGATAAFNPSDQRRAIGASLYKPSLI